jgi:hypothetical protein
MLPILASAQSPTAVRLFQSSPPPVRFTISAPAGEVKAGSLVKVHAVLTNDWNQTLYKRWDSLMGRVFSLADVGTRPDLSRARRNWESGYTSI